MRLGARRIVIFNHKGGVGKTTLTVNIAFELAALGKKVLLVDSDPQCNITSYLVGEDVVDDLLDTADDQDGRTIWSAVKPIVDAEGDAKVISPYELRDNLFLLPGDIQLSEFELELGQLWGECFQRRNRGFRGTAALSRLLDEVCSKHKIDFVFYDAGPNIGPLNRVILLDCDYFVVAAACDLFSVRALKTLGRSIAGWVSDWRTIVALAPSDANLLPGQPKFIGLIPQNFKIYAKAPADAPSRFIRQLERGARDQIVSVLNRIDKGLVPEIGGIKIGEVKDFGTLVSRAQEQGIPISEVDAGTADQRAAARKAFRDIANKIVARTG